MHLLDTNVVSEMRKMSKGQADQNVAAWAQSIAPESMFISAITLMELEMGVLRKERVDAAQGKTLRTWLIEQVLPTFSGRILSIDAAVAQQCAGLNVPDPRPTHDSFIGATALVHGMSVVTRNVQDFKPMGVAVINPWEQVC